MRRLLAGGLGWSLTWLATTASAAGDAWPAPWRPTGGAPAATSQAAGAAGVSLGRPQPASALPIAPPSEPRPLPAALEPGIQLTAYRADPPKALPAWGQTPVSTNFAAPQPMPAAPPRLASPPAARRTIITGTSDFAADQAPVRTVAAASSPTVVAGTGSPEVAVGPAAGGTVVNWMGPDGPYMEGAYAGYPGYPGSSNCLYARAEYLLWGIRDQKFPVLVTTGPPGGTGILGDPGTLVLFGGDTVSHGAYHGGRFTLGFWCDPEQCWGIEANYFFLGEKALRFQADSSSFPLLTRPFFNDNDGIEAVQITAAPGLATGTVTIDAPSRMQGAELNLRCNLCRSCVGNLDFLVGGRWLNLEESLNITEDVTVDPNVPPGNLPPGVLPGDNAIVVDDFSTRNNFYGIQFGLDWERRLAPRWVLNVRPKLGVGVTQQSVTVNGFQVVTHPDGSQDFFVGGLLALPSNIGRYSRTRFSVTTELNLNLGYEITESLTVFAGYSILYWSNVLRPANQIDRTLNINQIPNFSRSANPGTVRPVVPLKEIGVFAHGLNIGLEYRY